MASHRAGILHHPWVRSFAFYAAFRAVYGVGILIVTYIVASETQSLSASVGVLIASMIISCDLPKPILPSWCRGGVNPLSTNVS